MIPCSQTYVRAVVAVKVGNYQRQSLVPGDIVVMAGAVQDVHGIHGPAALLSNTLSDSLETAAS